MSGPPRGASYNPALPVTPDRLLGARIRDARIVAGLSRQDLADAMRVRGHRWTAETVDAVQTGRGRSDGSAARKVWAVELPALADCLGVNVPWLLVGLPVGDAPDPVVPLADLVFDYRTPAAELEAVDADMREVADVLIPAALHLADGGVPVLDEDAVDPARPGRPSEADRFQVFYGAAGQRAAVDRWADVWRSSRVAALRRVIAAGLAALDG